MGQHTPIVDASADGLSIMRRLFAYFESRTLAGEYVIAVTSPTVQILDPGGAGRDVLLPAEASSRGLIFIIFNSADAAEALTVKEDSDTTTIVTIAQNEGAIVFCDGVTWRGIVGANT